MDSDNYEVIYCPKDDEYKIWIHTIIKHGYIELYEYLYYGIPTII